MRVIVCLVVMQWCSVSIGSPQEEPFKYTLKILEVDLDKNALVLGSTTGNGKNHFTVNDKTVYKDARGEPLKDGIRGLKVGATVSVKGRGGARIGLLCTEVRIEGE